MIVIGVRELARKLSKLDNRVGESYLLVNASKKKIIAKIKIDKPPKEFTVIEEHLFKS